MLVTTTPTIEGGRITRYYGIVSGETIIGANVFRDFFASIRDVVGGRSGSYEEVLREAKDIALREMQEHARAMGANAVIGVDLDYETVGGSGSMLMVTACGTPDYIGTTGLAKALDYVSLVGMDKIAAYEHELTQYAMQRLKEIPGMRIFGEAEDKGSVISFLVGDIHHFDMGTLLDRLGIAVRTGHHCAQPLMQRLGIEGTVRASFGLYNTREEIDVLVAGIVRVSRMF